MIQCGKTATSPHGCPGPSTSPANVRAARTRPSPAAAPRETGRAAGERKESTLSSAVNVKPRTRRLRGTLVRGPSVAAPVRGRPWIPQYDGLQRYKVTHAGTEKNGPLGREFAAGGPFSQDVAGVGFEPTQLSRRFGQAARLDPSGNLPEGCRQQAALPRRARGGHPGRTALRQLMSSLRRGLLEPAASSPDRHCGRAEQRYRPPVNGPGYRNWSRPVNVLV